MLFIKKKIKAGMYMQKNKIQDIVMDILMIFLLKIESLHFIK